MSEAVGEEERVGEWVGLGVWVVMRGDGLYDAVRESPECEVFSSDLCVVGRGPLFR